MKIANGMTIVKGQHQYKGEIPDSVFDSLDEKIKNKITGKKEQLEQKSTSDKKK